MQEKETLDKAVIIDFLLLIFKQLFLQKKSSFSSSFSSLLLFFFLRRLLPLPFLHEEFIHEGVDVRVLDLELLRLVHVSTVLGKVQRGKKEPRKKGSY